MTDKERDFCDYVEAEIEKIEARKTDAERIAERDMLIIWQSEEIQTYKRIIADLFNNPQYALMNIKHILCGNKNNCLERYKITGCEFCFINDFINDFEAGLYEEESDE
jgi:hypothetical protein